MVNHFMKRLNFWERINRSDLPPLIISEIGSNFCGSYEFCIQSILLSSQAGADCVKFQTFKSEEFVASKDLDLIVKKDGQDVSIGTQYEIFKKLELPYSWHQDLVIASHSNDLYFSSLLDGLERHFDAILLLAQPSYMESYYAY